MRCPRCGCPEFIRIDRNVSIEMFGDAKGVVIYLLEAITKDKLKSVQFKLYIHLFRY